MTHFNFGVLTKHFHDVSSSSLSKSDVTARVKHPHSKSLPPYIHCVSYILTLMCKSVKFSVPNSACYSAVRILLIKVPCCNIMEAASDILYFWQSFLIQKSTDV